ncbi:MAG: shikimate kinase [Bacteroides sp.]|nr:shikimate kinase [Bacteroides sp.]MBD5285832.1 shikimate kinase [Bacteroides sp.]
MRPIFLIGYMGCGKSTLGRTVSAMTGIQFIDLDSYIEGRFRMTVSALFAERGEDGFRDIERAMLHEVGEFENVLVACGGGTPCFFDNMEWMNAHGTTVFLDTSIDKLFARLKRGKHKRPLIADKNDDELLEFINRALEGRMAHYSKAAEVFKSDMLDNEAEKSHTAQRFIDQFNITPV